MTVPMAQFELPIRIYWEDTDAGGIVFYANYLKFFERARTEWLRALGFGQHELREQSSGMFVVTEASTRYLRPARLDDELIVTARLERAGRASLALAQQALLKATPAAEDALLCDAQVRIGWVEGADLRPARIPSFILDRITA